MSPELFDRAIHETKQHGVALCMQTKGGQKVEIFARDILGFSPVVGLVHPPEGINGMRTLERWDLNGNCESPSELVRKLSKLVLTAGFTDGNITQLHNDSWNFADKSLEAQK